MQKVLIFLFLAILLSSCASQTELDEAVQEIAELSAKLEESEANYLAATSTIQEYSTQIATLESERAEVVSLLNQTRTELRSNQRIVDDLVCPQQITDMKYGNINDASTIIAAWWARQPDVASTHGTYRDHIWSNADTKIHAVRYTSSADNQPYVEHFLIYFREFGMKPAVFWIKGQCWLDRP